MLYQIVNPVITGIADKTPDDAPGIFGTFFGALIGIMLTLAAIWAFMNLLQGGLEWISSSGDKSKLENAQHRITNAIIGLAITFSVWAVYIIILQFLGLSTGGFDFILPKLF
jgi:hypothetical protein